MNKTMTKKSIMAFLLMGFCAALMAVSACAPSAPAESGDVSSGQDEAISVTWGPDSDCGMCHASEQASYDDSACLASQHADVACIDCHDDTAALTDVHDGATASDKMPKRLKKTEVADGICLSCHYGTKEALIAATPDAQVVDNSGTVVNPHNPPATPEHDEMLCQDCHAMHSDEPIQTQAEDQCKSCHHNNVFECYTCHE